MIDCPSDLRTQFFDSFRDLFASDKDFQFRHGRICNRKSADVPRKICRAVVSRQPFRLRSGGRPVRRKHEALNRSDAQRIDQAGEDARSHIGLGSAGTATPLTAK
jgi:hypothetical protein